MEPTSDSRIGAALREAHPFGVGRSAPLWMATKFPATPRRWKAVPSTALQMTGVRALGILAALIFLVVPAIQAQVFITVSDWEFAPGTADPTIAIRVSNTGPSIPLMGINLNLQIGDGGIEAGGTETGPRIVDVDLFAPGALFATRNNGRGGGGAIVPQLFEIGTLIPQGTTLLLSPGAHLLATVTLDLGALEAGKTWQVFLDTLNGTTTLLDPQGQSIPASLEGGTVSLVLVPESMWMAPVIAVGLMGYGILCRVSILTSRL